VPGIARSIESCNAGFEKTVIGIHCGPLWLHCVTVTVAAVVVAVAIVGSQQLLKLSRPHNPKQIRKRLHAYPPCSRDQTASASVIVTSSGVAA
jgi:hypothetical protein